MKAVVVIILAVIFHIGSPAAVSSCPKFCKCEHEIHFLSAKCSSLKFLHKINEKQANHIKSLDLSNISLTTVDKRIKRLGNLEHLNLDNNELQDIQYFPVLPKLKRLSLANNHIKNLSFSILPKGIEDLDISSNFLVELPKDWHVLHQLSHLHVQNNPVKCDESSVGKYVSLVSLKVKISENVICHYPKNLAGKNLQTLIADALLNPMLGDQEEKNDSEEEVGYEFIKHTTEGPGKSLNNLQGDLFEGSGDEGSGFSENEVPSACVIDCTTFKPLQILNNSSPLLSIKEQVGILFEDLFGKEQDAPLTTPIPSASVEDSSPIVKESVTLGESPKTTKVTEKLAVSATKSKETDGLERASIGGDQDGYTYYLIATVIVLMVLVAVFLIIKKRSSQARRKRKRNSMTENGICEEMKPLGKYKEISNGTEKSKEESSRPEIIPLMNGQNGKTASVKDSLEDLDVTLRTPSDEDSPKPERVTITASEIPPSVLRTPQLVHRQLTSDGEIITKPLDDSY